ncbi:MAG: DNA recombination protein RmuC [Pseudomonadota bacterium]
MIEIGEYAIAFDDPRLIAAVALVVVTLILILILRRVIRTARVTQDLNHALHQVTARLSHMADNQQQLYGGLNSVAEAQAKSQTQMLGLMEQRLASVSQSMGDSLANSATRTAHSLGELRERLAAIDAAQDNITKLSGDVLSLQDILSNKQTRGAFGEIQLNDIVSKALPPDSFTLQATLSNGKRADCLIHLPNPPGPIAIDAKFPLEAYEALRNAETERDLQEASRAFRLALRGHIKAIAEKYIVDGETADGALMFLPSEAVYAELHAHFPEVVREGFDARVWVVSPTTCMATLHTMRAVLKDARMRDQAGAIRKMLRLLHRDVDLVLERVSKLDTHFSQARGDLEAINVAADRAGRRAAKLDNFDFEALEPESDVVKLHPAEIERA